jgi:hypothetical protein
MRFDICIAVVAALTQFVTGYLGWQVTVEPLSVSDARRKAIYKHVFWASSLFGILAVTGGVFRAAKEQTSRDDRISALNGTITTQSTEIGNLKNTIDREGEEVAGLKQKINQQSTNIDTALGRPEIKGEHSYIVKTLEPGKKIEIDVVLHNYGLLDAKNLKFYYSVKISAQSSADGKDEVVVEELNESLKQPVETDHPSQVLKTVPALTSFSIPMTSDFAVTPEQVARIQNHNSTLYVAIVFYYKSFAYYQNKSQGHYVSKFCKYGIGDLKIPLDCDLAYDFGQYVERP